MEKRQTGRRNARIIERLNPIHRLAPHIDIRGT
jgi:hypothetical protein